MSTTNFNEIHKVFNVLSQTDFSNNLDLMCVNKNDYPISFGLKLYENSEDTPFYDKKFNLVANGIFTEKCIELGNHKDHIGVILDIDKSVKKEAFNNITLNIRLHQ